MQTSNGVIKNVKNRGKRGERLPVGLRVPWSFCSQKKKVLRKVTFGLVVCGVMLEDEFRNLHVIGRFITGTWQLQAQVKATFNGTAAEKRIRWSKESKNSTP
ncbi:hypothetical protein Trydic_g3216 [Trypoxylus dichotomus]